MKMKRKVILVVVAMLCLLGSGYAQKTEKMKVREWQSPVLKSARTCLEVQVQDYEPGMKKEGYLSWGVFLPGKREFALDENGKALIKFEQHGSLLLNLSLACMDGDLEIVLNPGENARLYVNTKETRGEFEGDYSELNQYLLCRGERNRSYPVDLEKIKGMTENEYILYCKELYDSRLKELSKQKKKQGEGWFRYAQLEALLDCAEDIYSMNPNFEKAYQGAKDSRDLPYTKYSCFNILQPIFADAGYDLMLLPDHSINKMLSYFRKEEQLQAFLENKGGYLLDLQKAHVCHSRVNNDLPLRKEHLALMQTASPYVKELFTDIYEKGNKAWAEHLAKPGYKIGKVPNVPKEQVFDSIMTDYRGEVVFVDFWYVYCKSCLRAMNEMEEVKQEFEKKGVKFLFITGAKASPEERWLKMIPDMSGDHYRVTNETYRYLIDEQFKMGGLPHYLIVDREGNIKNSFRGFMGREKMREVLENELKN